MEAWGWHVTLVTRGRRTAYGDGADLRRVVRRLCRAFGGHSVLFCVVDDHVHVVAKGERSRVGHRVSGFSRALAARGVPLQPAHIVEVEGKRHLENLVHYLIRQPEKHGVGGHPALWSGSCFTDLLGARTLCGFDPSVVLGLLPRWRQRDVWGVLQLEPRGLPSDSDLRQLGAYRIAEAASAAFGCTSLDARRRSEVASARQVAAWLATTAGINAQEVADALHTSRRSASALALRTPPRAARQVVLTRLALEEAVSGRGGATPWETPASAARRPQPGLG